MSRDQDAANEAKGFFSWGWGKIVDFGKWSVNGRGVEYQFICRKFQEDLYGKRNDYKLFKDDLYNRSASSNVRLSNLYKNLNGGAGFELDSALDGVPEEDKGIIRSSTWSWSSGDDMLTFSRNATKNILAELKFWQDMDNDQRKHVLKVAKKWYQKSRTDDPNANDYLCAADQLMCGINVGGYVTENGAIDGFYIQAKESDLRPKFFDYEPTYRGDFDPLKYIEELEKEIAEEEAKGKTTDSATQEPKVKEVPDKLPDDKKKPQVKEIPDKLPDAKKEEKPKTEMTPAERKASVQKGKEIWNKFMETEGKEMLMKTEALLRGPESGVSARGLTERLKDESDKSPSVLSENAEKVVETQETRTVSVGNTR